MAKDNHSRSEIADQVYVLDTEYYKNDPKQYKTTADGKTVLIPQPNDSTEDPLNWPQWKKNMMLAVVSYSSFMSDCSSAASIPALIPQAVEWHTTPAIVQRSLAGNLFCLGGGGLVAVILCACFGKLPVLVFGQAIALGLGIWVACATSFESYCAARIIDGFFGAVGLATGLAWIKDIYFFHEQIHKINAWTLAVISAPYVGPLIACFVLTKLSWRWCFWIMTILRGICLLLVVLCLDEPSYSRVEGQTASEYTRSSRLGRILGYEQWKSRATKPSVLMSSRRTIGALYELPIALTVVFYFINFAWIIGVNATVTVWLTTLYGFDDKSLGLFYLSGIIGSFAGWLVGHFLHGVHARYYMRKHSGRLRPEARLTVVYPASCLMVISVVLIGVSLQRHWHYMVVAVLFAVQIAGIMIATVGLESYLMDAYPQRTADITGWLNFARVSGGFMSTYVQLAWVERQGSQVALGVQGALAAVSVVLVLVLQILGERIRRAKGERSRA